MYRYYAVLQVGARAAVASFNLIQGRILDAIRAGGLVEYLVGAVAQQTGDQFSIACLVVVLTFAFDGVFVIVVMREETSVIVLTWALAN